MGTYRWCQKMSFEVDEPQLGYVTCPNPKGLHRMAYWQWGDAKSATGPTVLCMHGLTRTGRDFDVLATALARKGCLVVAPDAAGRGKSDKLPESSMYSNPQYVSDCMVLIARLDVDDKNFVWIGTSMGGIMAMLLAPHPLSPIKRLVMNDIGPFISAAGLERIK